MAPYQYWLDNYVKTFSFQFNFLPPSIYELKTDEVDPSFLTLSHLIIEHTPNFYNTQNHRTIFLSTKNIPHHSI